MRENSKTDRRTQPIYVLVLCKPVDSYSALKTKQLKKKSDLSTIERLQAKFKEPLSEKISACMTGSFLSFLVMNNFTVLNNFVLCSICRTSQPIQVSIHTLR